MYLLPFVSLSLCQASNPIDVAGRPGAVPHTLLQKDPRVSISSVAPESVRSGESNSTSVVRNVNAHICIKAVLLMFLQALQKCTF